MHRGILRLRGHLLNDSLDLGDVTILGECAGKKYTLFYAQLTQSEFRFTGPALVGHQEFRTDLIFVDVHTVSQDELKFTKFRFETHLLDSWLATKDFELSETENEYRLSLKKPLNRTFHISENVDLSINYKNNYTRGFDKIQFRNHPHFESNHNEALSVGEFHRSLLMPLLNFMTLANANTDYIFNLTGIREDTKAKDVFHEIRILSSFRMTPAQPKIEKSYRRWIDPDAVNLEECLARWFSLYKSQELILDEYFATKYNHDVYLEDQFFRIAKTLDSWARTVITSKKSISQEALDVLAQVESVLTPTQFKYLGDRLSASDSMRDFILNLVTQQDPIISQYISNWNLFIKRLVETRNKYVHIVHKKDLLTFEEMYVAKNLLELIINHELLRHVGLSSEVIRKKSELSVQLQIMRQSKLRMREDLQ